MKANEMMQGDIVLYEYDGQKFPARVIEIYRNSVLVESINSEYEPIEIEEDKIFPVSLTQEILEKNGFYLNGIEDYNNPTLNIDYGKWAYENEDEFDVVGDGADIKYVHQLQHALRLCGIDKEIVL